MGTIYVLWIRGLKHWFRSRPRMIGSIGQPLLLLIALGFGFGPIFQKAGGGDYIQFLTPGIVSTSVLMSSIFAGMQIIWDRQFGFLRETLVAPVSRLKIAIGTAVSSATVATLQGLLVLLASFIVGFRPVSASSVFWAVVFMFLIAMLFSSIGIVIGSAMKDMHGFVLILNFLVMPIFVFSGWLFPLKELPKALMFVSWIDPLTYGVDGLRALLTGAGAYFGIFTDFAVVIAFAGLFLAIGSYLFSKIQI